MAASRLAGSKANAPTADIVAASELDQLSLKLTAVPLLLKSVIAGSIRAPGRLKGVVAKRGPIARIITCFGAPSCTTKPVIMILAPVPT